MTGLLASLAQSGEPIAPVVEQFVTPSIDVSMILPNLVLMLGGILLLTLVSVLKGRAPSWLFPVWTISTAVAAICTVVPLWQRFGETGPETGMGGSVGLDGFSLFATIEICLAVIFGALLLSDYLRRERLESPEWYVLVLLSASGAVTMVSADDLIVLFVGLEILSVAASVAIPGRRTGACGSRTGSFALIRSWPAKIAHAPRIRNGMSCRNSRSGEMTSNHEPRRPPRTATIPTGARRAR